MKRFYKSNTLGILAFTMFVVNTIYGQARLEDIESRTDKTIDKLAGKMEGVRDTTQMSSLIQLSNSASTLFENIKPPIVERGDKNMSKYPRHEPDSAFINSLKESQEALNELLTNKETGRYTAHIIESIKIDYDLKIKSYQLKGTASDIQVSVVTQSGRETVSGYNVFYTYMWDSIDKKRTNRFNNPTNNAIRILSPGFYFFWIEKDGKIIQSKPGVEIGNLPISKEKIIFYL